MLRTGTRLERPSWASPVLLALFGKRAHWPVLAGGLALGKVRPPQPPPRIPHCLAAEKHLEGVFVPLSFSRRNFSIHFSRWNSFPGKDSASIWPGSPHWKPTPGLLEGKPKIPPPEQKCPLDLKGCFLLASLRTKPGRVHSRSVENRRDQRFLPKEDGANPSFRSDFVVSRSVEVDFLKANFFLGT